MIFGFGKKTISFNGMSMSTWKRKFSFVWVSMLYFGFYDPLYAPSVTWHYPDGTSGILSHGKSVKIVDGMRFNVAMTGSA